jgi:hypothetical protein
VIKYIPLLLLAGCCSICPPKIVYVAAECPQPITCPISPDYRTEELPPSATGKDTIEAYVLDLETCQAHSDQLENLLNAYGASYKEYKIRYPDAPK